MSIATLLVTVRDQLRSAMSLGVAECDVQPGCHPPPMAGELFIGIDDGGAVSFGGDEPWLGERYTVIIGVMRRMGTTPSDMTGDLLQREAASVRSLEAAERKIKQVLHGKQLVRLAMNATGGLPSQEFGEQFIFPLFWRSQSRAYVYSSPYDQQEPRGWIRRDLNFVGADRKFLPENIA